MKVFNLIELNTFEILKGWIKRLLDLNRCKESSSNFLWIKRFLSCKLVAINIQGITTCELIIIGSKAKIKRSYFNKKLGYVNHLFCIDFYIFLRKVYMNLQIWLFLFLGTIQQKMKGWWISDSLHYLSQMTKGILGTSIKGQTWT